MLFLRIICTTERTKENESIRQQRLGSALEKQSFFALFAFGVWQDGVARPKGKTIFHNTVCVCVCVCSCHAFFQKW